MEWVVVGTGRCGSMWLHKVLQRAGVDAMHETVFTADRWTKTFDPAGWSQMEGEVSNGAAAFLDQIPQTWPVLHLVRDPFLSVASFHAIGAYGDEDKAETEAGIEFRNANCPAIYKQKDPLSRCVTHVVEWNHLCERAIELGHPYLRVRVEDIDAAGLDRVLSFLTTRRFDRGLVESAVTLRPDYNTAAEHADTTLDYRKVARQIKGKRLHGHLDKMAQRYGYPGRVQAHVR